MAVTITVDELRVVFNTIIIKLEHDSVSEMTIEEDLYWDYPRPNWTDMENTTGLHVGSLFDDVESLKRDVFELEHISYLDFDRVASILKYISENQNPSSP
ncbi:MAG: hypothetical protein AAF655_18820 [Bacteroidota bacterium]